jgi:hypothetical protein
MATFTIEAPDGRRIKVEAETPELAMQGAQEWAAANPAKPATNSDGDVSVGSVARSLFRGIPFIGTYRDEMAAKLRSSTTGGTYDEELAKERAKDKAFNDQHPYLDTGLNVAGGVGVTALTAPAALGAGAAGAAGRTLLGLGAKSLPGAIGRGAVAGTLQGAAAGSGEAEPTEGAEFADRAMGGLKGAAIGGALGAAIPGVIGAGAAAGRSVYNRVMGGGGPLDELAGGARRYVGQLSSEPGRVQQMQTDLQRLGPDAMLADVSPEWRGVAGGAASRPGSRDTVVNALNARDAGKNQRLAVDLDSALGPAGVPSQIEVGLANARRGLGPDYADAFRDARAAPTQRLADQIDSSLVDLRGESRRAVERVRGWLNIPGTNQLDPHPNALFQVRQEIDGLLEGEKNSKVIRELTIIRRDVDGILAESVPGIKNVDAQFQELSRQSAALTRGGTLLDSGKTATRPQELAQELRQAALPDQEGRLIGPSAAPLRMQQGVRAEIDRVAGTNANDPIALQRLVKGEGDWNRDKLAQLYGDDRARAALGAIDREVTFRDTQNRIVNNSETAPRTAFLKMLERAESPLIGSSGNMEMTAWGTTINTARRIGSVLTGAMGKQRANTFATELARAAIAQGVPRDEFVAALQAAGVKQALISRTLDLATRGGLIVSREAATELSGSSAQP